MYFEKIKHVTCAKSLMAYAVNDTAKNWVAFITHPDSKILEPLLTSIQSFFVSIYTINHITTTTGITNLQKTLKISLFF